MVAPQDNSDFKFVNTSNHPIYIEAYITGDRICINIWGIEERDANRSVRFRTEILSVSWPETLYNIVVNDTECQVGEVRVNYKHQVEVEVHPALSCVSYKQIYIDGQLVEEEELNRDSYKAAPGLITELQIVMSVHQFVREMQASLWYFHISAGQLISQ